MKRIYTIILLSLFAFQACKKNNTDTLTGSWQLSGVYNPTLSLTVPRPANTGGNFVVKFYNNKAVSGHTFKNTFNGSYTLSNNNELRFGIFEATKIWEDTWGGSFNQVLMSCVLQSVSPCTPSIISLQDNELKITTPYHDELTFTRMP